MLKRLILSDHDEQLVWYWSWKVEIQNASKDEKGHHTDELSCRAHMVMFSVYVVIAHAIVTIVVSQGYTDGNVNEKGHPGHTTDHHLHIGGDRCQFVFLHEAMDG